MKKIFSWQFVIISLITTIVTGAIVNGPIVGTGHLQTIVPGVTIPDITPQYSPEKLAGFFQAMGEEGRAAYIVLNNFDFLFIVSNALFGFSAIGMMLRALMKNKTRATQLALLGLMPALFDAIESVCFRLIVTNPYSEHLLLSNIAATATKIKFAAYNVVLLLIVILLVMIVVKRLKKPRKTH